MYERLAYLSTPGRAQVYFDTHWQHAVWPFQVGTMVKTERVNIICASVFTDMDKDTPCCSDGMKPCVGRHGEIIDNGLLFFTITLVYKKLTESFSKRLKADKSCRYWIIITQFKSCFKRFVRFYIQLLLLCALDLHKVDLTSTLCKLGKASASHGHLHRQMNSCQTHENESGWDQDQRERTDWAEEDPNNLCLYVGYFQNLK